MQGVQGETITDLYALIIHILMYNFLCLYSDQTLVFCRCVHAEYNNYNSALKTPIGPAVGVLSCVYRV